MDMSIVDDFVNGPTALLFEALIDLEDPATT